MQKRPTKSTTVLGAAVLALGLGISAIGVQAAHASAGPGPGCGGCSDSGPSDRGSSDSGPSTSSQDHGGGGGDSNREYRCTATFNAIMRTGVDAQAISIITFSRMSEDQSLYIPGLTDDAFDVLEAMANKRGFFGTQGTQYNGRSDMSNEAACNEAAAKARQDHNRVLADHPVQGQQAADYVHRDGNFSTLEWRRGR